MSQFIITPVMRSLHKLKSTSFEPILATLRYLMVSRCCFRPQSSNSSLDESRSTQPSCRIHSNKFLNPLASASSAVLVFKFAEVNSTGVFSATTRTCYFVDGHDNERPFDPKLGQNGLKLVLFGHERTSLQG